MIFAYPRIGESNLASMDLSMWYTHMMVFPHCWASEYTLFQLSLGIYSSTCVPMHPPLTYLAFNNWSNILTFPNCLKYQRYGRLLAVYMRIRNYETKYQSTHISITYILETYSYIYLLNARRVAQGMLEKISMQY